MILIDLDMPKSCMDCPMNYDYVYCSLNEKINNVFNYDESRHEECPLMDEERDK